MTKVKKHNCQVQTDIGCNNQVVRRYTGTRENDPKFWCCIGCHAILRRQGVRLREVATTKEKKP